MMLLLLLAFSVARKVEQKVSQILAIGSQTIEIVVNLELAYNNKRLDKPCI